MGPKKQYTRFLSWLFPSYAISAFFSTRFRRIGQSQTFLRPQRRGVGRALLGIFRTDSPRGKQLGNTIFPPTPFELLLPTSQNLIRNIFNTST